MHEVATAAPAPRAAPVPQPPARPTSSLRDVVVPAVGATLVTLVLTGLVYPLAMTGIARALFPAGAGGSLVQDQAGNVVGSELLAQPFARPVYFQPRPSAAGEKGWDTMSSGGSNLGPTSKKLQDGAKARLDALLLANADADGPPPVELVTASGSGLDPHLSPAAALWQAPRVAKARGIALERVRALVQESVEGRDLGIFGEPRVNVLLLNLALDRRFGAPPAPLPPPRPRRRRPGRSRTGLPCPA
jgi:K+-transporting ATPase ATPase C chain